MKLIEKPQSGLQLFKDELIFTTDNGCYTVEEVRGDYCLFNYQGFYVITDTLQIDPITGLKEFINPRQFSNKEAAYNCLNTLAP